VETASVVPARGAAVSWGLYDFAYSIFSFLLLVRFFPTWIINDLDRPDWFVSVTQFAVVLIILVAMPLAGALADHLGRRKPFLIGFTLLAIGASVTLGVLPAGNVAPLLLVAGAASAFSQLAFAQYDPLLADVAPPAARGRVSGMAVALGFAGVIFALGVVAELIVGDGSKQQAFVPAALLYLVFALPAFLVIKEQPRRHTRREPSRAARHAVLQVARSLRNVRRHRHVFQFLAGRFLYSDAIATLSAFMTVYMTRLGGFSETEKNLVIGVAVLAAAGGALVAGRFVGRLGPKRPLLAVLPFFALCIIFTGVAGWPWTVWVAAPVAGLALGVVWTADRVFMLRLTPLPLRGQFFGFFNLSSRVASALGPLIIWSGTVWLLHERTHLLSALDASRVAVVGLGVAAILGWLVIRPLPETDIGEGVTTRPTVDLSATGTPRLVR
jgi:UMF1 family MFS transporter